MFVFVTWGGREKERERERGKEREGSNKTNRNKPKERNFLKKVNVWDLRIKPLEKGRQFFILSIGLFLYGSVIYEGVFAQKINPRS